MAVDNSGSGAHNSPGSALVVGIDEAGRGPIIGPMVIASVLMSEHDASKLGLLGVRDSKELSTTMRERLANTILGMVKHVIIVRVPPALIDTVNLNQLEIDTFRYTVERMFRLYGEKIKIVYIDSVGPPEHIVKTVKSVSSQLKVVATSNADKLFIPVAAASIIAKVIRDREIRELSEKYGVEGSGYPTDPRTVEWIRRAYRENPGKPPPFIRRSWSTLKKIAPGWYKPKTREWGSRHDRSLQDFMK